MALGDEVVVRSDPDDEPEAEEDEPEITDPVEEIREDCNRESHCSQAKKVLDECQNRVSSKSETTETCHEEMIDYIHALDHCVSKTLFSKLK